MIQSSARLPDTLNGWAIRWLDPETCANTAVSPDWRGDTHVDRIYAVVSKHRHILAHWHCVGFTVTNIYIRVQVVKAVI